MGCGFLVERTRQVVVWLCGLLRVPLSLIAGSDAGFGIKFCEKVKHTIRWNTVCRSYGLLEFKERPSNSGDTFQGFSGDNETVLIFYQLSLLITVRMRSCHVPKTWHADCCGFFWVGEVILIWIKCVCFLRKSEIVQQTTNICHVF